jgi:hypothetical protein
MPAPEVVLPCVVPDAFAASEPRPGWLDARARADCLRVLHAMERARVTGGSAVGPGPTGLSALFEAAAAGLDAGEREAAELRLRQGFTDREAAAVLGLSRGQAVRLLDRASRQLEASLASLLAGRAWDRERGATPGAPRAGDRERAELRALLAAGAAESFRRAPGAPADLRLRTITLAAASTPAAAAHRATVLARAGAFRRRGFPRQAARAGRAETRRAIRGPVARRLSCQGRAAIAAVVALAVAAAAAALGGGPAPVPSATRARPPAPAVIPSSPGPGTGPIGPQLSNTALDNTRREYQAPGFPPSDYSARERKGRVTHNNPNLKTNRHLRSWSGTNRLR